MITVESSSRPSARFRKVGGVRRSGPRLRGVAAAAGVMMLIGSAIAVPTAHAAEGANSAADWMGAVSDDVSLGSLSIPGTHDTMTYGVSGATEGQSRTQSMTLPEQLDAGVRMIDIRVRINSDANDSIQPFQFTIHHGADYTNSNFADVLSATNAFLKSHPSETVLMRLKAECTGDFGSCKDADLGGLDEHSALTETLANYRSQDPNGDILTDASFDGDGPRSMPTLGEVRGKMVLVGLHGRHDGVYGGYGLSQFASGDGSGTENAWNDWRCEWVPTSVERDCQGLRFSKYVQDEYSVPVIGAIPSKRDFVRRFMDHANQEHQTNPSSMYVNWASGASAGAFPSSVALGSWPVQGVNEFLRGYLEGNQNITYTGAVMLDFPDQALLDQIIARNYTWN